MSSLEEKDKRPLRVAFDTLGCRSNYADTIDLQAALLERGAVPCDLGEDVDVYVLNTCTVTDQADKEAYKLIRRAKREAPNARIVVTGCYAEVGQNELEKSGLTDTVIGPGRQGELIGAIVDDEELAALTISERSTVELPKTYPSGKRAKRSAPAWRSISLEGEISTEIAGPGSQLGELATRARYHLRVQEGCENSCTFCIIPTSRGRLSSRQRRDILADLQHLDRVGYREVVLTGTHLGGYGEDIGDNLFDLMRAIEDESPVRRIRLSSIDPNDLSRDIIDLVAESDVFCSHLHICVQAFSDRILKRMNRRYSLEEALEILYYVDEKVKGCCIGSDVLCGFPGETREDVEEEIECFTALPISYVHVFPYSERSGTAATKLDGSVPLEERRRRAARWRSLGARHRRKFSNELCGKLVEAVFERTDGEYCYGTTREYASVKWREAADTERESQPQIGEAVTLRAKRYDEGDEKIECEY